MALIWTPSRGTVLPATQTHLGISTIPLLPCSTGLQQALPDAWKQQQQHDAGLSLFLQSLTHTPCATPRCTSPYLLPAKPSSSSATQDTPHAAANMMPVPAPPPPPFSPAAKTPPAATVAARAAARLAATKPSDPVGTPGFAGKPLSADAAAFNSLQNIKVSQGRELFHRVCEL